MVQKKWQEYMKKNKIPKMFPKKRKGYREWVKQSFDLSCFSKSFNHLTYSFILADIINICMRHY